MLVKQQRAALEGELAHCIKSQDSAQEPHWEMAWQQEADVIRGQIAELAARFENVQNYFDYDGTKVSRGRMQLGSTDASGQGAVLSCSRRWRPGCRAACAA